MCWILLPGSTSSGLGRSVSGGFGRGGSGHPGLLLPGGGVAENTHSSNVESRRRMYEHSLRSVPRHAPRARGLLKTRTRRTLNR